MNGLTRQGPSDLVIKRPPLKDLTNETFTRLTVLEYLGFSKSSWRSYWKCLCTCGNIVAVRGSTLGHRTTPTESCGCLSAERASARQWQGCGDLSRHYWNHIKHHAFERNLPCNISIEEAWSLFVQQAGRCALSGLEITLGRYCPVGKIPHGKWPRLGTASLDRKDSAGGYVSGNVQWVHKEINRMKGTLSDAEFINMCGHVARKAMLDANQIPPWRPEAGL